MEKELIEEEEVKEEEEFSINKHEMRVNMIKQMDFLEIEKEEVQEYMEKSIKKSLMDERGKYYMLMSRDSNYYTLFTKLEGTTFNDFTKHIKDFLVEEQDLLGGGIRSFQVKDDGVFEIWYDQSMYLLFNYDKGVEEV